MNPIVVAINSTSNLVDPSLDMVVVLHGFTGSISSKSVTLIRDGKLSLRRAVFSSKLFLVCF